MIKLLLQYPNLHISIKDINNQLPEDLTINKQIKKMLQQYKQEHNL